MKIYTTNNYVTKLEFCCDQMSEYFLMNEIYAIKSTITGYVRLNHKDLDIDFCPFCGKEINVLKE